MNKNFVETFKTLFKDKKAGASKPLPERSTRIRVPTQRPIPQFNHRIKRETQQVSKEWSGEVAHTDEVLSQLPQASKTAPTLSSKKVQRFPNLLKKLEWLEERSLQKMTVSQPKTETSDSDELWRDMIKPHEERHFRIGRVTNFFT
jgi:hypothetical protein